MDSSKALFWNTFLQECQLLTEKETKQPHQWENIYHTTEVLRAREDILQEDKLHDILMCTVQLIVLTLCWLHLYLGYGWLWLGLWLGWGWVGLGLTLGL